MLCLNCGYEKSDSDFSLFFEGTKTDGRFVTKEGIIGYKRTGRVCDACRFKTRPDTLSMPFYSKDLGEPYDTN